VNEIISFQKLVRNLHKMTIANLGRQHRRSISRGLENINICLECISYYFISYIWLRLVIYIFKVILLMIFCSLNSRTILCNWSY
jgi:hypothetical protein